LSRQQFVFDEASIFRRDIRVGFPAAVAFLGGYPSTTNIRHRAREARQDPRLETDAT
jgi:hypothetical protein